MGRWLSVVILIIFFSLVSCSPHRVIVLTNHEQYGFIYDPRFYFPVTYKPKYVDLKGVDTLYCEIQSHTINNLYFIMPANVYRCVDYFDGHGQIFFEPKGE